MRPPFSAASALGLLGSFRAQSGALRVVTGWVARHRTRRTLGRLDPHLLQDIGLTVQDASAEISKPFWRD